jgi:hypothetical protein
MYSSVSPVSAPNQISIVDLRKAFCGVDPFVGYEPEFPLDTSWSNGIPEISNQIFEHVFVNQHQRPSLIIEVGSWKGASAIKMTNYVAEGGAIVCIDTWLGSYEMYQFPDMYRKNGYPKVYYQFLSNVIHSGKQNIIVPMPITSNVAAALLRTWGVKADAVYIDGSHDYYDTKQDLENYWPLVKEGGVLFGDDYEGFPGVRRAADEFSAQVSSKIEPFNSTLGQYYYIMEK